MEGRPGIHQIPGGDAEVNSGTLSGLNSESKPTIDSKMKVLPSYFTVLFVPLLLALEGKLPALSKRRALSAVVTILVLLLVIAFGVLIVYAILTTPGTSTTTYP